VSIPPTYINGKQLSQDQQRWMFEKSLDVLAQVNVPVRWMSLEPLSWDVAPLMQDHPLQWAVIGAASRGRIFYQPKQNWVSDLLNVFDGSGTPVFMKSNLAWTPRRMDMPIFK
jgi:protein gp37